MIAVPATDSPKPSKPTPDSKRGSAPSHDTPAVFNGGPARRDETADETPPREQRVVFHSARFGLHQRGEGQTGLRRLFSSIYFSGNAAAAAAAATKTLQSAAIRWLQETHTHAHTLAVIRVC